MNYIKYIILGKITPVHRRSSADLRSMDNVFEEGPQESNLAHQIQQTTTKVVGPTSKSTRGTKNFPQARDEKQALAIDVPGIGKIASSNSQVSVIIILSLAAVLIIQNLLAFICVMCKRPNRTGRWVV